MPRRRPLKRSSNYLFTKDDSVGFRGTRREAPTPRTTAWRCARHKTFDRGAYTLSESREVLVSERAHGTAGFEEWLMRFHGRPIQEPVNEGYLAREAHLAWHQREVFRGLARVN